MSGCRAPQRDDAGFTLVELVVALMLFGILAAAALPPILTSLNVAQTTRAHTQAKNLTQERIETMRNLEYHVDETTGQVDLLDLYFAAAHSTPPPGAPKVDGEIAREYVASGGDYPQAPEGPFYAITTDLAGDFGFTQYVYSQFLDAAGMPLDATQLVGYDSAVPDQDSPPSLNLGVTVVTLWESGDETKSYSVQTRIADQRPQEPLVEALAQGDVLTISTESFRSGTPSGLQLRAGVTALDGTMGTTSTVRGQLAGFMASESGMSPWSGSEVTFAVPPELSSPLTAETSPSLPAWFAATSASDPTAAATLPSGLPNASIEAPTVTALEFSGDVGELAEASLANEAITGVAPFVSAVEPSQMVSTSEIISTEAPVTTTSEVTTKTGAVALFPQSPLAPPGAAGLVEVELEAGTATCTSDTGTVPASGSAQYTLRLTWWGVPAAEFEGLGAEDPQPVPQEFTTVWTWSGGILSQSGHTWAPETTLVGTSTPEDPVYFADLLPGNPADWSPALPDAGAATGIRGLPGGVATIVTLPVYDLGTTEADSAIRLTVGRMICAADDRRLLP